MLVSHHALDDDVGAGQGDITCAFNDNDMLVTAKDTPNKTNRPNQAQTTDTYFDEQRYNNDDSERIRHAARTVSFPGIDGPGSDADANRDFDEEAQQRYNNDDSERIQHAARMVSFPGIDGPGSDGDANRGSGLGRSARSARSARSSISHQASVMSHKTKRLINRASVFHKSKMKFKDASGRALNQRSQREIMFVILAGLGLSFNSGFINGLCISGLLSHTGSSISQSVAGMTGSYTNAGLALASGDPRTFGFEMSIVFSFMAGSFISGIINPRAVPHQLGPKHGPTFLVGSVLLFIASTLSCLRPEGRELFYFAAASNGLQNGVTSIYTANLIRTSHLTGTTTDIGLFLGQMARGNKRNAWKCYVLVGLALSFWLGSVISFFAATAFRSLALFFNACFFLFIALSSFIFISLTQRVHLFRIMTGNWQWEAALSSFDIKKSDYKDGTLDAKALETFDRIDYYGRGYIEADELYVALKATGMHVTEQSVKSMLEAVPTDDENHISRSDFLDFVRSKASKEGKLTKAAKSTKKFASGVTETVANSTEKFKQRLSDRLSDRSFGSSSSSQSDDDSLDGNGEMNDVISAQ